MTKSFYPKKGDLLQGPGNYWSTSYGEGFVHKNDVLLVIDSNRGRVIALHRGCIVRGEGSASQWGLWYEVISK